MTCPRASQVTTTILQFLDSANTRDSPIKSFQKRLSRFGTRNHSLNLRPAGAKDSPFPFPINSVTRSAGSFTIRSPVRCSAVARNSLPRRRHGKPKIFPRVTSSSVRSFSPIRQKNAVGSPLLNSDALPITNRSPFQPSHRSKITGAELPGHL